MLNFYFIITKLQTLEEEQIYFTTITVPVEIVSVCAQLSQNSKPLYCIKDQELCHKTISNKLETSKENQS